MLIAVGSHGYGSSLSVTGSAISLLRYFDEGITTQFTTFRANGVQVRCLLE